MDRCKHTEGNIILILSTVKLLPVDSVCVYEFAYDTISFAFRVSRVKFLGEKRNKSSTSMTGFTGPRSLTKKMSDY